MSKHTPRPWKWYLDSSLVIEMGDALDNSTAGQAPFHSFEIAKVYGFSKEQEKEAIANAQLIAAAPELLETAKELVEHAEEYMTTNAHMKNLKAYKKLKEAIAKAEGDTNE